MAERTPLLIRDLSTRRRRTAVEMATLAIVYAGTGKLGLSLGAVSGFATLVWPPTGLALAALLLFGFRLWPGVLLGAFAVNWWTGAPVAVALGIGVGNTLEAVLGAYAIRKLGGFSETFGGLRQVLCLIVCAATLSTLVSATIGVAALGLSGIVRSMDQAVATWRAWWVGDVLGDLVVAPVLLTWGRGVEPRRVKPRQLAEALALSALLGLASYAVFFRPSMPAYPFESPYILFPLFVWAALRFELRGATLATALAAAVAVSGTARGSGPFARDTLASGLLALQTFMGCAAITPLVVAGITMDRARAIRAHEAFLTTVSHDLRNPLHAILMSGELLSRAPTESGVQKHQRVLKASVQQMMRLIADLLDASAIERGRLTVEPRAEDARALVGEVLDVLSPLAVAKKLTLQAADGGSIALTCDRGRMLQVLSNVIGNAIKFSPEHATVAVKVGEDDRWASFSVHDAGPGISAANLPHVFERNWHTKPSAGGGSGLGLFISKGIVEAHGGRIWAESTPGRGSTFHIVLPTAPRLQAPFKR